MKKFNVSITYYAEIEVSAENEENAQTQAEKLLSNNTELLQKCTTSIDFCAGCEEMMISICSSCGYAVIDYDGNILENELKDEILQTITKFNTKEYFEKYQNDLDKFNGVIDILSIGYWYGDNKYEKAIDIWES